MSQSSDLTSAVVQAVAEHEEIPPADLPPLEEFLDPETFHQLTKLGSRPTDELEFSYLWYRIKVEAGSIVAVDP